MKNKVNRLLDNLVQSYKKIGKDDYISAIFLWSAY